MGKFHVRLQLNIEVLDRNKDSQDPKTETEISYPSSCLWSYSWPLGLEWKIVYRQGKI